MAITLKRQLTDPEKLKILTTHGRKCWATGHMIDEEDKVQFDHLRAFARDGASEFDNIAPMCEVHNKQKGTLPLEDFRVKLRQNEFFATGDSLTLGDLLKHMHEKKDVSGFGEKVVAIEVDGGLKLEMPGATESYRLYACPNTGWKYFYATLPVRVLDSDDDKDDAIGLQPRYLIPERVFELYRHFQRHPVLQPSIGRLVDKSIKLFDGQHKIAGLLWTGRREFECKIYLTHDVRLLNQTNISAHDKFAQARFFSSIMVGKLGVQFGLDFQEYRNIEDDDIKTEERFLRWLDAKDGGGNARAQRSKDFKAFLYNSILEHADNKLTRFVSRTNRSTDECPLTMDLLSKSIFSCFLYRDPVDDNLATDAYRRHTEINNVVYLMNCLNDLALSSWNPKAGQNDSAQRKLRRMFTSKAMMAWSEILRDAICGKLGLLDEEDRSAPFYRELDDDQKEDLRGIVERLAGWKWWSDPPGGEIDKVLTYNKGDIKQWFKEKGLTTGYLMGAPE